MSTPDHDDHDDHEQHEQHAPHERDERREAEAQHDALQTPLSRFETAPDELQSPRTRRSERANLSRVNTEQPSPRHILRGPSRATTGTSSSSSSSSSRSLAETPFSPVLRRRADSRANTFRAVDDYDAVALEFESSRPGWQPGSEPGYDPSKPDGGHAEVPALHARCDITVSDFDQSRVEQKRFGNEDFIQFLARPQPRWSQCRWININGLSWDVIQAVGQHKGLHKLAIEDIMNTRNRTKTDWYPDHAFIVLTLQKLVRLVEEDSSSSSESSDSEDEDQGGAVAAGQGRGDGASDGSWGKPKRWKRGLRKMLGRGAKKGDAERGEKEVPRGQSDPRVGQDQDQDQGQGRGQHGDGRAPVHDDFRYKLGLSGSQRKATKNAKKKKKPEKMPDDALLVRTLQRYHASPNEARTEYMEKHSSLKSRNLAVSAEQVSIFLTSDNTVISFFEVSAEDIERPISVRLATQGTILRQSCDASLLVQAVIDAIIDLALPLTAVYQDVIGDVELDVLTSPSIRQSRSLYICISEINKMLTFLNPIENVVNVLRDHVTGLPPDVAVAELQNPASGVIVSPQTHTYLGDVLDHWAIITEAMEQIKRSADNLIDLIFNTISANQNESMKQLTVVTIVFLPLTFLTGYFGQNFEPFDALDSGIASFWAIALPVVLVTVAIMLRNKIFGSLISFFQRRHIVAVRKRTGRKRRAGAGGGSSHGRTRTAGTVVAPDRGGDEMRTKQA